MEAIKQFGIPELAFCNALYNLFSNKLLELISIVVILVIISISFFGINFFLNDIKRTEVKRYCTIKKARRANKLSSEFLLAYILPLIAFDYTDIKDIVLFVIYFAVLAFLCIRNNNVYTNILFEFKGYKMYECDIEYKIISQTNPHLYTDCLVISKNNLTSKIDAEIAYYDFDNYIYINIL